MPLQPGSGGGSGGSRKAGGAVAESVVAKQLHGHEEAIRYGKKETAVLLNAKGEWVVIPGKKNAVEIPISQWLQMRGGMVTHNHPSTQGHRGRMGQLARMAKSGSLTDPLSPPDMAMAQKYGLREMRAVGLTRKYRYRPRANDVGIEGIHRELIRRSSQRLQSIYDRAEAKWAARLARATGPQRERIVAMASRSLNGILAGQNYISQTMAFRSLKKLGYDVKSKRGRPLVR